MISIIVPTLNESGNLPVLAPAIVSALEGRTFEIIVVDDGSTDGTREIARKLGDQYPLKLLPRDGATDGLSGAVIAGMREATGDVLVCMDADLQHPPTALPRLVEPLETDSADFVIGSRYVPGASTAKNWGVARKVNSVIATLLARPFVGEVADPMSGFFALKAELFRNAGNLSPIGYKIALELMAKCNARRIVEIPIDFGTRHDGDSKLSMREQLRYIDHLSRLYDFTFPRSTALLKFTTALGLGWALALGIFACLLPWMAAQHALPLSYVGVIAAAGLFQQRTLRGRREANLDTRGTWARFSFVCACEWLVVLALSVWGSARLVAPHPLEVMTLSFSGAAVVRYILRKELLMDIRGVG